MEWTYRRPLLLLKIMVVSTLVAYTTSRCVDVAAQTSGGVMITAVIAPVRDILVNNQGVIQQIVSNTSEDVSPKVYQSSFHASQTTLSPDVNKQYQKIMLTVDTKRTGIVYRATPRASASFHTLSWQFLTYQSVLPLKL